MGTDSKYLEEAIVELENLYGALGDSRTTTEITEISEFANGYLHGGNNMSIQGGQLKVLELFDNELAGDKFNGYFIKTYDGEKFVYTRINLDVLFNKISRLEKGFEKDEYLYGSIIGNSYVRYYKHHTIAYRLDLEMINEYSKENYVSNEISRDVKGEIVTSSGNYIADSLKQNKVTAKEIETGKKVFKYVVTYESKPILVEDTGHYITLETGCYKWVEE